MCVSVCACGLESAVTAKVVKEGSGFSIDWMWWDRDVQYRTGRFIIGAIMSQPSIVEQHQSSCRVVGSSSRLFGLMIVVCC